MTQTAYAISDVGRSNSSDWAWVKDCDTGILGTLFDCINNPAVGTACSDDFTGCGCWQVAPNSSHLNSHSMYFEVGLGALVTPGSRTNHKVVMKVIDSTPNAILIKVEILQSSVTKTLLQQLYAGTAAGLGGGLNAIDCTAHPAYDDLTFDFDPLETADISDYSALTMKITVTKNGGGNVNFIPNIGLTTFQIPDGSSAISLDFVSKSEPQLRTYNKVNQEPTVYS